MSILLNISIPTYNRPRYLERCLLSIKTASHKLSTARRNKLSIFISDNSSNEESKRVASLPLFDDLRINYYRNVENIGSDKNIANCYLYDDCKYLMILGDDDYLSENSLLTIFPFLEQNLYPVIYLKAYGLTNDEVQSRKDILKSTRIFNSISEVLEYRNIHLGFISNMIFSRAAYSISDVTGGIGTNLVQLHLVLNVIKKFNGKGISLDANLIMSTRNNTGGYDPVDIFCTKFFALIESILSIDDFTEREKSRMKDYLLHTFYNRSIAQFMRAKGRTLSTSNLDILDIWYRENNFYKFIYRRLFQINPKFSFYPLTLSYVLWNIIYNRNNKFSDFLYHLKVYIKRK